jgi:signal transduction histidine kinase
MFYKDGEHSGSTGLGLYIVKKTVEKLKGEIQVMSEPGKGTTFTILIPNSVNQH